MNLKDKASQLKTCISTSFTLLKDKETPVMAKKKHYAIFFSVLFLFLLALWYLTTGDSEQIEVRNGILDIETWDIEANTPLSLNGKWEFYWSQFFTASDISETVKNWLQ